jgi:hypothetical protein
VTEASIGLLPDARTGGMDGYLATLEQVRALAPT